MNCIPGGYESELSDCDDEIYDQFFSGVEVPKSKKSENKSPMDLKKERLLDSLSQNNITELKHELDNGERFDIDEPVDNHWNLLFHACFNALPKVVRFLICERGASVRTTFDSDTPLMAACYSTNDSENVLAVVKILVEMTASFRTANIYGITALMFASRHGHTSTVRYLLSLNDAVDAIDNEGKNALFHAIDGKHDDIAEILIGAGIDIKTTNKYRINAENYARDENCEAILNLFPQEEEKFRAPGHYMCYAKFENCVPGMSEIPDYFPDVVTMLRGMNSERFIDNFAEANVNLYEFLTITEERLKEIGIRFNFERNTILVGLHNFHNTPWTFDSLYIPEEKDWSELDMVVMLANVLRQLVVVKSQIVYMERLGMTFNIKNAYKNLSEEILQNLQEHIKKLKKSLGKKEGREAFDDQTKETGSQNR